MKTPSPIFLFDLFSLPISLEGKHPAPALPAFPPFSVPAHKPFLFAFASFALLWSSVLLFAGGFTTSIQAGMAFLDWPLSNGSLNPAGWTSDPAQLAEHSHRLAGFKLGLLSLVLAVWIGWRENRRPVRRLAFGLLAMVIFQGLLGGLRVLFDRLNTGSEENTIAYLFQVLHACGAQAVVVLLTTLVVLLSRTWILSSPPPPSASPPPSALRALPTLGLLSLAALSLQILLGALMRHAGAGLAVPTFPLTPEGHLLPAHWNAGVVLHMAHRLWAVAVTLILLLFLSRLWAASATRRPLAPLLLLTTLALSAQIFLGALTIWTVKNPHAATLHMLFGAVLMSATTALTLLANRFSYNPSIPAAPLPASSATVPTR